jgi:hypothetical protein
MHKIDEVEENKKSLQIARKKKVGKLDVISKPIDEVEENKKSEEYPREKRASG